jgi:hypothetical protein
VKEERSKPEGKDDAGAGGPAFLFPLLPLTSEPDGRREAEGVRGREEGSDGEASAKGRNTGAGLCIMHAGVRA